MVTIKPAVRPTAISTRTINIKLRLLNKSSDGKPVKLTTAKPKIKDITTRMGVGTPLIPNNGEEITNEPTRTVARKNKGNIVRISDLFLNYKDKKRKNIYPIGFVIGDKNVFLTNSDGKMIIAGIEDGK